jgi:Mrp family chromosome partitioning ATPase
MSIPSTHAEIEQIYLAAELSGSHSLCITACQPNEGVTSVASALVERYLLAGHKALLVDLNMFNPAFKELSLQARSDVSWVEHIESKRLFTGVSVPQDQSTQLAYKDPAVMGHAVKSWLTNFDRVIVDTSPLLQVNHRNIPAQSVASACDKTILVVKGGSTTSAEIEKALELLSSEKISLLGSVLNIKDQPSLGTEIIRQIGRVPFLSKSLRRAITKYISQSEFLSQSA